MNAVCRNGRNFLRQKIVNFYPEWNANAKYEVDEAAAGSKKSSRGKSAAKWRSNAWEDTQSWLKSFFVVKLHVELQRNNKRNRQHKMDS